MATYSRRQKGFTLIEAAVAIAVVAILSGIIVPLVVKNLQDSQIARAKNDIQVIAAGIASQIKDTGNRPSAVGPNACTGVTDAIWESGGTLSTGATQATAANTFTNLFTLDKANFATPADLQKLFFGATTTTTYTNEFAYKGPYLAGDVAAKSDPWGGTYLTYGYNANGQTNNSPIWVVCAGPDKTVNVGNATATSATLPPVWNATLANSADDIVVRVN